MRNSFVAPPALSLVVSFALACAACSSSSAGSTGNDQNKGDAGEDVKPDTGTPVDSSTPPDDTGTSDDTGTEPETSGIDVAPPPNKCAGVTCSGSYMKCCPSTGACYDTRYGTCY